MTTIRAKYRNGVLTPLEPLEIEEGAEVIVSLENAAPEAPEDAGTEENAAAPANGAHAGPVHPANVPGAQGIRPPGRMGQHPHGFC